ncbi:hypothetical protein [Micromonospora carbonacea]|uniref:hypothetical protein n=1 Tax=Micromonospora carbonacea TaxID=47853 RepID=UPI00371380FF
MAGARGGAGPVRRRPRIHELASEWLLGAWLAYRDDRAAVAEGNESGVTIQLTPQKADRLDDNPPDG